MKTSEDLQLRLLEALEAVPAVDIHTYIDCSMPVSMHLWDLLGHSCIARLAFSSGAERDVVTKRRRGEAGIEDMVAAMSAFDNTMQYRWIMDIARDLFGFSYYKLTLENWEELAESVKVLSRSKKRDSQLIEKAGLEKIFVMCSFKDDFAGMDSGVYLPVLDAGELVFGMQRPKIRKALKKAARISLSDSTSLRDAVDEVLKKLIKKGCPGVCVRLPAQFKIYPVVERDFDAAIEKNSGEKPLSASETANFQCGMLFLLAELCNVYGLPVLLLSGGASDGYHHGVSSGRDLPVAGATLRSLLPLFSAFPKLNWCLSVLSGSQGEELCTYGKVIQNVVVSGHGLFHAIPEYIKGDLRARIQSIPKTKLIGYYSDMNKLEFGYAQYKMYRRLLAEVLADEIVLSGRGDEDDALVLGRHLLRDNALRVFALGETG